MCGYQCLLRGHRGRGSWVWQGSLHFTTLPLSPLQGSTPSCMSFWRVPGERSLVKSLKEFYWKRRIEIIFLHSFQIGQLTTLRIYFGMPTLYPAIFSPIPCLCRSFLIINITKAPTWCPHSSAFSDDLPKCLFSRGHFIKAFHVSLKYILPNIAIFCEKSFWTFHYLIFKAKLISSPM